MKLRIEQIKTDSGTQARESINEETVCSYAERMEDGDVFPPVIVFHDGNEYYLADGFHRVMASSRISAIDIEADVRKGTAQDALWYALGANKAQGHRMTKGDVRHAVEAALRAFPERTQQAVAEQVGCCRVYVLKIQEQLVTSNKLTIPQTRIGADGKSRPTTYTPREHVDRDQETSQHRDEVTTTPQQTEEARYLDKDEGKKPVSRAIALSNEAIAVLQRIPVNDPQRELGLRTVAKWIKFNK